MVTTGRKYSPHFSVSARLINGWNCRLLCTRVPSPRGISTQLLFCCICISQLLENGLVACCASAAED